MSWVFIFFQITGHSCMPNVLLWSWSFHSSSASVWFQSFWMPQSGSLVSCLQVWLKLKRLVHFSQMEYFAFWSIWILCSSVKLNILQFSQIEFLHFGQIKFFAFWSQWIIYSVVKFKFSINIISEAYILNNRFYSVIILYNVSFNSRINDLDYMVRHRMLLELENLTLSVTNLLE